MGDTLSQTRCASASGTAGKVGDFASFPLEILVVNCVEKWWLPFPFPHSAELCRAFGLSWKEIGAGSLVTEGFSEFSVSVMIP